MTDSIEQYPEKVLTVKQPWAHLLMTGDKDVENRTRRANYRGRVGIHVALAPSKSGGHLDVIGEIVGREREEVLFAIARRNDDAGHIIGTIDLIDCVRDSASPWAFEDHWHWVMGNPVRFAEPIPARGALGLWNWPKEEVGQHAL